MSQRLNIIIILFGLGIFTALAGLLVYNVNADLKYEGKSDHQNQNINHLSNQSIIDLLVLREAMREFVDGNKNTSHEQLSQLYDLYKRRLSSLLEASTARTTNSSTEIQSLAKQLIASINQLSPLLRMQKSGDINLFNNIMGELQHHKLILNSLQQQIDLLDKGAGDSLQGNFKLLRTKIIWVLTIGLFIIFLISVLFLIELRKKAILSDRMDKYSVELEQTITERTADLTENNKLLEALSLEDSLTGLYNRRYFDEALNREFARASRSNDQLSLLMCDIDYFKQYNDSFGHQAGDHCLQMIARSIQAECQRGSDIVVRYGGEEFAILLPDTSLKIAIKTAVMIGNNIWSQDIDANEGNEFDRVTLSIGVAELMQNNIQSQSNLISVADRYLYDAKNKGRNQLVSSLGNYQFRNIDALKYY